MKESPLRMAIQFLAAQYPDAYIPDKIHEILHLPGKISSLERNMRKATKSKNGKPPLLIRSYRRNAKDTEDIAVYAINDVYLIQKLQEICLQYDEEPPPFFCGPRHLE